MGARGLLPVLLGLRTWWSLLPSANMMGRSWVAPAGCDHGGSLLPGASIAEARITWIACNALSAILTIPMCKSRTRQERLTDGRTVSEARTPSNCIRTQRPKAAKEMYGRGSLPLLYQAFQLRPLTCNELRELGWIGI